MTIQWSAVFGRLPEMLIQVAPPSTVLKTFCPSRNPVLITYTAVEQTGETARWPNRSVVLIGPATIGVTLAPPARLMLVMRNRPGAVSVSYTHLTLPTSDLV